MDSRSSATPATIGRFRIDAVLGKGGMGEVYKAFDPTLQRTVAVKTVRPDIDRPEFLDRLFREAQACARLRHPNVVTVYEAGEIDGVVFIAMEYLSGEDLGSALKRGTLSFEAKIRILIQVLEALHHTHGEGVIHRDIKPSNVHLQADGSVKVVDFGLARVVVAETMSAPGMLMCTPDYASPEQLRGEKLDGRTDIYSTGALAYEMFSGRRPFQSENDSVAAIVLKVISEPPPPMDVSWSRKFPEIERIVGRAMAKSPADRYQSAEDMRNALTAFVASSREAIASAQAEANVYGQRMVIEARTLIAAGMHDDARTMLSETLRANPDAAAVRQLLGETLATGRGPSGDSTVPVRRETPANPPAAPRPAPQPTPDQLSSSATTIAPRTGASRQIWWLGGAAAAAVIVWAFVLMSRPPAATAGIGTGRGDPAAISTTSSATPSENPAATSPEAASANVAPTPETTSTLSTIQAETAPGAMRSSGAVSAATRPEVVPAADAPAKAEPIATMSAKELFAGETGPAASVSAGLRYRLTRRSTDGAVSDVDPATTTFHSGDGIRFAFDSNVDGYLYVVQQGSSGGWTVLFPGPQINGGLNAIRRSEQYQVPSNGWFLFDANPGTEQVFVFLSKAPLTELPGFDKPVTKTETVMASVVKDLQQRIQSRDLLFEKDTSTPTQNGSMVQATYVVNKAEVSQSVAANITLIHGQ